MASEPPALPGRVYKRRFQNMRTITALVLREMASTYGRTPGGYIWAVLEPLGMILVLTLAFSVMLRTPSLGTSFVLFYATGMMPFRMYQQCQGATAAALRYFRALLAYPVVSFADALLARLILTVMTQIMVTYLILGGVMLVIDVRLVIDFGPILGAFGLAMLLGFGVGTMNCFLFDMFPVWKSVYSTVSRPLMLLSAVIYIYEDLPAFAQQILWFNPLVHVTGLSRTGFYDYYEPDHISILYILGIAMPSMLIGLMLLRRHYRKLLVL